VRRTFDRQAAHQRRGARIAANIAKLPGSAMTAGRWLLAFGFGCLAVVVLTHLVEKLNLFPVMG
jgi:hypothetical protein